MNLLKTNLFLIGCIIIIHLSFIFSSIVLNKTNSNQNVKNLNPKVRKRRWYAIEDDGEDFWRSTNATQDREEEVMERKGEHHMDLDEFWADKGLKEPSGYNYEKHMYADEVDENSRRKRSFGDIKKPNKRMIGSNKVYYNKNKDSSSRKVFENIILKLFYEEVASIFLSRKRVESMFKEWQEVLKVYTNLYTQINKMIIGKDKNHKIDINSKKQISVLVKKSNLIFSELSAFMKKVDAALVDQFGKMQHWHGLGAVWDMDYEDEDEEKNDLDDIENNIHFKIDSSNKKLLISKMKHLNKKNKNTFGRRNAPKNRVKRSSNEFFDWLWAPPPKKKKHTTGLHLDINSPFKHLQIIQNVNSSKVPFVLSIKGEKDKKDGDDRSEIPVISYDDYDNTNAPSNKINKINNIKNKEYHKEGGVDSIGTVIDGDNLLDSEEKENIYVADYQEDIVEKFNREKYNIKKKQKTWKKLSDSESAMFEKTFK